MGRSKKSVPSVSRPGERAVQRSVGNAIADGISDWSAESEEFEKALQNALDASDFRGARTIVSEEEVRQSAGPGRPGDAACQSLSAAKAKLALASGDAKAAHAILLAAIERMPKSNALRMLMAEVMLAGGRASDVRAVLKHVGPAVPQDKAHGRKGGQA